MPTILVFHAVKHSGPELGVHLFPTPYSQNVFPTIQINPNSPVYRFSLRSILQCGQDLFLEDLTDPGSFSALGGGIRTILSILDRQKSIFILF